MNEQPSQDANASKEPRTIEPGSPIEFRFMLEPDDSKKILDNLTLNFHTTPEPPPPAPPQPPQPTLQLIRPNQPADGMGSPQWVLDRDMEQYDRELNFMRQQQFQNDQEWEAQHPVNRFQVPVQRVPGTSPREHVLRGTVPFPTPPAPLSSFNNQGFTLFAGEYHLESFSPYVDPQENAVISLSAEAKDAIDSYVVLVEHDFAAPAPPPPENDVVDDLHFDDPVNPKK